MWISLEAAPWLGLLVLRNGSVELLVDWFLVSVDAVVEWFLVSLVDWFFVSVDALVDWFLISFRCSGWSVSYLGRCSG